MKTIQPKINAAKTGDIVPVLPGIYKPFSFDDDWGVSGQLSVLGVHPDHVPVISKNPVSGSNTISVRDQRSVELQNMIVEIGDHAAGIMTYTRQQKDELRVRKLLLDGFWNGDLNIGNKKAKWGVRSNHTRIVDMKNVVGQNIYKEHFAYIGVNELMPSRIVHKIVMDKCTGRRTGRTFLQAVSYEGEGPSPKKLEVAVTDCLAIDNCLTTGGGGSAFTFRGGFEDAEIYMDRITSYQGCDPGLHPTPGQNITGHLVLDRGPNTNNHPYSANKFILSNYHFETGSVYPGLGSARRPFMIIEDPLQMIIGPGKVKGYEGVLPYAMTFTSNVPDDTRDYHFKDSNRHHWDYQLKCVFNGTKYDNYGAMIDALSGAKGITIF
jgi:hypothetical protein